MRNSSHVFAGFHVGGWEFVESSMIRTYVGVAAVVAVPHGKCSQVRYGSFFINFFCKSSKDGVVRQPEKW